MRGRLKTSEHRPLSVHRHASNGLARLWLMVIPFLALSLALAMVSWEVHHGHWRSLRPIIERLHL
jgi:hypothetical protein